MKFIHLDSISGPTPLKQLSSEQLMEVQRGLKLLGYPVGDIDGLIGPKTRNAWAEFKADIYPGNPKLIGRESIAVLRQKISAVDTLDPGKEFDFSTTDGTLTAIMEECRAFGLELNTQVAYVLATTQWETNQTFKPVREAYWMDEGWRREHFTYYPYYGRGYVQLTWKKNYERYTEILEVDMVNEPDRAMDPRIALFVLVHGFKTGTFTGRKITDYINEVTTDFIRARRCINGTDRAHEIAEIAEKFLAQL